MILTRFAIPRSTALRPSLAALGAPQTGIATSALRLSVCTHTLLCWITNREPAHPNNRLRNSLLLNHFADPQEPTVSEQAAKADAYCKHHSHEDLQKETVAHHIQSRRADKVTSSPNDSPTESEDISHSTKHPGSPEELQKETVKKAGNHEKRAFVGPASDGSEMWLPLGALTCRSCVVFLSPAPYSPARS